MQKREIPFGTDTLVVRTLGAGPPLLFVHGWPLHGLTFAAVAERLAPRFECHLLDLPGAGSSTCSPATDFTMGGLARAVRAAADGLGLERYGLVAFDSGGTIARIAAADDDRVAAIVLGNTEIPGHRPPWIPLFVRVSRLPGSMRLFRLLLRSRRIRRSKMGYGGCFYDRDLIDGQFHDQFVNPLLDSRAALAAAIRLLHTWDWKVLDGLAEVHAQLRMPVQLIWGAEDRIFPLARARAMAQTFSPPARLDVIERARLLVHAERPDEFALAAADFLAGVLTAGRRTAQSM
jgi:pimeloyl-ACP methyl ester carboxylesterase